MGSTSTHKAAADLQAEYDALPKKNTREAGEFRAQIKAASSQSEPQTETVAGSESYSAIDSVDTSSIAPDMESCFVELKQKSAVYWLGVIPGQPGRKADAARGLPARDPSGYPPSHSIDGIGGRVTFTEYHTPNEGVGQSGTKRRGQYAGALVRLTEGQVSDLREGLRCSIVRWRQRKGAHAHGHVVRIPDAEQIDELKKRMGLNDKEVSRLRIRAEQFELYPDDEPVAKYVYCIKVDHPEAAPGAPWRPSTTLPPSILQVGSIESP